MPREARDDDSGPNVDAATSQAACALPEPEQLVLGGCYPLVGSLDGGNPARSAIMKVEICRPAGMTRVEQSASASIHSWRKPDGSLYIRVYADPSVAAFATIVMTEAEVRQHLADGRPSARVLTIVPRAAPS